MTGLGCAVILAAVATGQQGLESDWFPAPMPQLLATISMDDAARRAQERHSGRILGAKEGQLRGKRIFIIKILTPDGRIQHIRVDPESGAFLKKKRDIEPTELCEADLPCDF